MVEVQSQLESTKKVLQQKENEHLEKYKNNVDLLEKYVDEKK